MGPNKKLREGAKPINPRPDQGQNIQGGGEIYVKMSIGKLNEILRSLRIFRGGGEIFVKMSLGKLNKKRIFKKVEIDSFKNQ